MARIFISHRNLPPDNAWAENVHRWIKDQKGIGGFLDFDIQDGLQAGARWEDEIYAAMRSAQVVIAIVSKAWLASDWCLSEARMARLMGSKLILLITEECEIPFRDTQSIRLDKHGEAHAFEALAQALRSTHALPQRPYPGLAAFEEKDAAVFFGRDTETRDLVNAVHALFQGRPKTPRLLLLLGASGSGKSSLMRAGLVPEFKAEPDQLCVGPIIPSGDAVQELADALGVALAATSAEANAETVLDAMTKAHPNYSRALILLDQAEELLRADQSQFWTLIQTVLDAARGRVMVLATIRSDFLNAFQQSGLIGAGTALPYETFTLDPLPKDRLPEIIQKPAALYDVSFEDGLVAQIMDDHGGPDALPLLAFFLSEFWRRDYIADGVLQLSEYDSFGGLGNALKKAVARAMTSCKRIEPDEAALRSALRDLFLGRLVAIHSASGDAVRTRANAERLDDRQRALLAAFAQERLLIEKAGAWEVVHEALLRQWEALRDWITEAREDLVTIDRIEAAAQQWDSAGQQATDLTHSGNRLAEAQRILKAPRYEGRFDRTARNYVRACTEKELNQANRERFFREAAEAERDRARIGETQARRFLRMMVVIAVVALGSSAFAIYQREEALSQTQTAQTEAQRALKNQRLSLAALSESELKSGRATEAVMLALAAWPRQASEAEDLYPYMVALEALSRAGIAQKEILRLDDDWVAGESLDISPSGSQVAAGLFDGGVLIWDRASGAVVRNFGAHDEGEYGGRTVFALSYAPDGTSLATGGADGTVRIWTTETGTETARLDGAGGWVRSVVFSPSGALVAAGLRDGTARVWHVASKRLVAHLAQHQGDVFGNQGVLSVAFSPDGKTLATGGVDATARIWDLSTNREIAHLPVHATLRDDFAFDWVNDVAFTSDGRHLITASGEGAKLWDLRTGAVQAEFSGHRGAVRDLALSPNGAKLATGGNDRTIRVWDIATGREELKVEGQPDASLSLVFSPDGSVLATGRQGAVQLWDIARHLDRHSFAPPGDLVDRGFRVAPSRPVEDVAIAPNGTWLATGNYGGMARVLDVTTGQEAMLKEGHRGNVRAVAISPDGARVASGDSFGTIKIWDARTGEDQLSLLAHDGGVDSIAFSPDGAVLASGGADKTARLWNSTSGAALKELPGHEDNVLTLDFSPDGTGLATGGFDVSPRVWDVATGQLIRTYGTSEQYVDLKMWSVQFSPDGKSLATGHQNGAVYLWDVETGKAQARLNGHVRVVQDIAFSPDGTRLATASADHTTRAWDLATASEIARFAGHEGSVTSVAFAPDGTWIATGGEDGTTRLWNVDFGPGTLFDLLCARLPTTAQPEITATYGLDLGAPICSGEEPLPPRLPQGFSR